MHITSFVKKKRHTWQAALPPVVLTAAFVLFNEGKWPQRLLVLVFATLAQKAYSKFQRPTASVTSKNC